ncbi:MAG: YjgN family protein [Pseudomonadota bacterium]
MEQKFEFRGDAKEWFGIWIVNLVLTLATFGIYSAWAKVRRNQYFYNNTYVAGRNFDYHATGKQILIGRLIVFVGFIVYSVLGAIPILGLVLPFLLLFLLPWLIVRALMFNARMSSWSNVRFGFTGKPLRAFLVYFLFPFLSVFTLGLAYPLVDRAAKKFSINNHRLGSARFDLDVAIAPFYKAAGIALAWIVLVLVVFALPLLGTVTQMFQDPSGEPTPTQIGTFIGAFYGIFILGFLPALFIYQAFIRNAVYNSTTLQGGHRFRSTVAPLKLFWIAVSNAVIVLFTIGLMLPWAQIRLSRYLADNTSLLPGPSLDEFVNRLEDEASALGDAYADLDGFDVGLPV